MEKKYRFDQVAIMPRPTELSSRSQINLEVNYITKWSRKKFVGIPVIASNMDVTGNISMARAIYKEKFWTALHKYINEQSLYNFMQQPESKYSFITLGMNEALPTSKRVYHPDSSYDYNFCIDVANGYMYKFLDRIKQVRDLFPNSIIMAGNVCTPEGVENIIKAGADIAKCGIASGGVCDTRNKAGIYYPQFSVAQECGAAANELGALCCSDGGIKTPADICKALGAGSHMVMCGSIFAGYEENEGEWEYDSRTQYIYKDQLQRHLGANTPSGVPSSAKYDQDNKRYVFDVRIKKRIKFYGMSSKAANDKYNGGLKDYRTSEGLESYVDYKGPVSNLLLDIKGGLASCCTYTNTHNLENLKKHCDFIEV